MSTLGSRAKTGTSSRARSTTLLSRREKLSLEGRQALKRLLAANKRLNTAYLLKESFRQLWSCEREGWARRFFENWQASLKWQRLKPYQKFTQMIERHWDGIAAYCKLENKVASGVLLSLAATTPAHRRIRIALLPPLQEWVEAGERITNS